MQYWPDHPDLLAGKDLLGGGTWLGITRGGRLAVITNFRDTGPQREDAPSRGELVTAFLNGDGDVDAFSRRLEREGARYNGFNLIFGDLQNLAYYSNQTGRAMHLGAGVYGLSNHLLDTPWPKVELGKGLLHEIPRQDSPWDMSSMFDLLTNTQIPPDHLLPETGLDLAYERTLASIFVVGKEYGTRCSTVIEVDRAGRASVCERTYLMGPNDYQARNFQFQVSDIYAEDVKR
jgi:uncharacterized protein with NRDE domain